MSQVVVVIGGGPLSPRVITDVDADAVDHRRRQRARSRRGRRAATRRCWSAISTASPPTERCGRTPTSWRSSSYPLDKDATDTELALVRAAQTDADTLLVFGAAGDRFDHALGTIAALGIAGPVDVRVDPPAARRSARLRPAPRQSVNIDLPADTVFSLLALHGPCRGVDVTGARWPLTDAALEPHSTRGISNETTGLLYVAVADGILTLVVP